MTISKICFKHLAQVFLLFNEKVVFLIRNKTIFKTYLRLALILKAVCTNCFLTAQYQMILQKIKNADPQ